MSAITLTHKIRLDPTCKQENYFRQACAVARFTWNWALAQWKKQYEAGKKPNGLDGQLGSRHKIIVPDCAGNSFIKRKCEATILKELTVGSHRRSDVQRVAK